jgi:hydroxymethylbilane synthase
MREEGVFVKELESALLAGRIDLAVHSLKDMPVDTPEALAIAAVTRREDPRDALVTRGAVRLSKLPAGARIGTDSLRRACQLRALRPDLRIVSIRGNVDTRIRKVEAGEAEGVVMAVAALARMGWLGRAADIMDERSMLPAPGQGAIALEIRADDAAARRIASSANDFDSERATTAERAFLRRLGGGCRVPIAALGRLEDGKLRLKGLVGDEAGERIMRDEIVGRVEEGEDLGVRLAERLLSRGAADLVKEDA